ncbi:MAG: ferrochelatase [Planctomycetota bacterium]
MDDRGLLLVNLGTPASTEVADVRAFLAEFLGDPWVIDLPTPFRQALVRGIICPVRGPRSAEAYREIWTDEGSPLLVHSQRLAAKVAALRPERPVVLAMRYGKPSIAAGIAALRERGVRRVTLLPLFPQRSSSTTTTTVEAVRREIARSGGGMELDPILDFFAHPGFVRAQAAAARPLIEELAPERILASYHGVPEDYLRKDDPGGSHCLWSADCCATVGPENAGCYRAQCRATSRALAAELGRPETEVLTAFQSRFGSKRWTVPATDEVVVALARQGVRRLLVLCPAFVADCLETLEEIGLRLRETFLEAGGEAFAVAPCVNADDAWAEGVVAIVRDHEASSSPSSSRG